MKTFSKWLESVDDSDYDDDAYWQGHKVGFEDKPSQCPYKEGTSQYKWWQEGFKQGYNDS